MLQRKWDGAVAGVGLALAFWIAAPALAAVTPGGDTTLAAAVNQDSIVGNNSLGTLSIDAGSSLVNRDGYIGNNVGSTGTVAVSGAASRWTNNFSLEIGWGGNGTLMVEAGGQVTSNNTFIGYHTGSTGTATVTGAGSAWAIAGTLWVGAWGTGSLRVADGGSVTTQRLYASMSNLRGNGTITVSGGAVLDADLVFDATHGTTQAIPFGSGGTLNLTLTGNDVFGVGYQGAGSLRIADGVIVTSTSGYIGYHDGSVGTAIVTGTGSKWNNSNTFSIGSGTLTVADGGVVTAPTIYAPLSGLLGNGAINAAGAVLDGSVVFDGSHPVAQAVPFGSGGALNLTISASSTLGTGYRGTGDMRIAGGVTVASAQGYVGYNAGSTGTATVSGTGSKWTNGSLRVGFSGSGTLRIEAGGNVSDTTDYVGNNANSSGTVTVTGTGSTWANTSKLYLGYSGSGTLRIETGGQVSSVTSYVGYNAGSSGTATVTGAGAIWTSSSLLSLGDSGSGALNVEAGGQVSAGTTYLGYNAGSTGTLKIEAGGRVGSSSAQLGVNAGSTGAATVTGAGATWTASSAIVGYFGGGSLRVEAGGQFNSSTGNVGYNAGSTGTVQVVGSGSTWVNSQALFIAPGGTGTLTVADGGVVTTNTLYASLGDLRGNGTINVSSGAVLDAQLDFDASHPTAQTLAFGSGGVLNLTVSATNEVGGAGYKGTGSLRIADGVVLGSADGYLGLNARSVGAATVSGAGSAWNNSAELRVGYSGSGVLTVAGGGQVTSNYGSVAYNAGSTGAATVTGSGSTWNSSTELRVGYKGAGTLKIEAGGHVGSANAYVGYNAGSAGTVIVGGTGATWANTNQLFVGNSGSGTLRIEAGGRVDSTASYLAYGTESTGSATVTGAGATWSHTSGLFVGRSGSGTLAIRAGGRVSNITGYLSYSGGSTGTATVEGAGSLWASNSTLYLTGGTGVLTVADGGKVTAKSLSINNRSTVRLHVSGDDMIVVGDTTNPGGFANSGVVAFYANPLLPPGVYRPISERAGRSIIWSGNGTYRAFGGTWDATNKTFSVAPPTTLATGAADALATGERLLITEPGTGRRVGLSFGAVTGTPTLTAAPIGDNDAAGLLALLGPERRVAAGWDFVTDYAGGEVLLSFEVGPGLQYEDIAVWHLQDGVWSAYAPASLTYDSGGWVNFTVNSFSGHAVAVPEPASLLGLVAPLALMLLARRRR